MVPFIELTYVGLYAALKAGIRGVEGDAINRALCDQPTLFKLLQESSLPTHGLPMEVLLDRFPTDVTLLQTFAHLPFGWNEKRGLCLDVFGSMLLPVVSSRERHQGKTAVKVNFLPFVGDPLTTESVRRLCRSLKKRPLTALDALAFALTYPTTPRPFCAVNSVFVIEGERFVLSFEDDQHGLPILEFRREGHLPQQAFIPVYVR